MSNTPAPSQRVANISAFIAVGLLLLLGLFAVLGNSDGGISIALGLALLFVVVAHLLLGVVAVIAALLTGRHLRNARIHAYFGSLALLSVAYVAAMSGWNEKVADEWERLTDPETVALREAAGADPAAGGRAARAIAEGADIESRDEYQRTPLMLAAHAGNAELTNALLQAGAVVKATGRDGETALHFAAAGGAFRDSNPSRYNISLPVIESLLGAGAEVDARTGSGLTPLVGACTAGSVEAVQRLAAAGADLLARAGDGNDCLLAAVESDQRVFVKWLVANADRALVTGAALARALVRNRQALFAELLEAGADTAGLIQQSSSLAVRLADERRDNGAMLEALLASGRGREAFAEGGHKELWWAAGGSSSRTLANLLALGLDPNVRGVGGDTVLHSLARVSGGESVEENARLLIAAGADIEALGSGGGTPLRDAARRGNLEMLKLFVEQGADLDAADKYGETAMLLAAREGFGYIVEALAAAGATPPPSAEHGRYLVAARENGNGMRALLALGLDPDIPDERGVLPLYETIAYGDPDALAALVEAGVDLLGRNRSRYTPLTAAADRDRHQAIAVLLRAGVDANKADGHGRSPLDTAIKKRVVASTIELLRGGAAVSPQQRESIEQRMLGEAFRGTGHERKDELRGLL